MLNSAIVMSTLDTLISRAVLARFVPVDYSRLAQDYDQVRGNADLDRDFWFAGLVETGRIHAGERILDLGAGTGRFAVLASQLGPTVAFDLSLDMISKARGKGLFTIVRGDAHALPFRRDSFDVAFAVMVVHQLRDLSLALRELARVSHRVVLATADMARRAPDILDEAFPSLMVIDRARFPRIEAIAAALPAAGFPHVWVDHRPYVRAGTVAEQLDRVRRKYISTLDLLPSGEFERGLAFLESELPRRYGERYETSRVFTFVGASR